MTRNGLIFGGLLITAIAISAAAGTSAPPPVDRDPSQPPLAPHLTPPRPDAVEDEPSARQPDADTAPSHATVGIGPREVVRDFAEQSINWSWRNLARQFDRAARVATPRLRKVLERNAAQASRDVTLTRDRAGNRGRVIAIDIQGPGATRTAVVVTREIAFASGVEPLGGAEHRVYLATVARGREGWAVDRWEQPR